MTKPLDPYSRIYWRVLDDLRFEEVRSDMRHFGSWALMLVVADMAYPAPAFVPPTIPKASLRKLIEVGLVETLRGGLFHVHGLPAERAKRSPRATDPEPDRTPPGPAAGPNGSPTGPDPEPLARAIDETRRDEKETRKSGRAGTQERPAPADEVSQRRYDRMVQRRHEWFRQGGAWDPEWGPEPEAKGHHGAA